MLPGIKFKLIAKIKIKVNFKYENFPECFVDIRNVKHKIKSLQNI